MKKAITFAAFAFVSLAATSAHAQSTISPVPGAPDRPHQTAPTVDANDQITGQTRSDGQMSASGTQYKKYNSKKTHDARMSMSAKKEERKEMKMQKKADKAGSM